MEHGRKQKVMNFIRSRGSGCPARKLFVKKEL